MDERRAGSVSGAGGDPGALGGSLCAGAEVGCEVAVQEVVEAAVGFTGSDIAEMSMVRQLVYPLLYLPEAVSGVAFINGMCGCIHLVDYQESYIGICQRLVAGEPAFDGGKAHITEESGTRLTRTHAVHEIVGGYQGRYVGKWAVGKQRLCTAQPLATFGHEPPAPRGTRTFPHVDCADGLLAGYDLPHIGVIHFGGLRDCHAGWFVGVMGCAIGLHCCRLASGRPRLSQMSACMLSSTGASRSGCIKGSIIMHMPCISTTTCLFLCTRCTTPM